MFVKLISYISVCVGAGELSRDLSILLCFCFLWDVPSKGTKTQSYILRASALTEMSYLARLSNVYVSSQMDVLD